MAVSRNALVNTFNDGMNKDLNPILTPNTVMTDCLNGTIVTYNGNEFALQNDLGNYKFKHGELSDGFVPIGMKEHANILYIISYNPIEDKVEIGSFPSMKNIENGLDKTCTEKDLNTLVIEEGGNYNYTDESKNFDLTFLSELGDDYILNPGDQYKLIESTGENGENPWYITKSYYIMSENHQLYDITSVVEVSDQENDFKHVSWNVPGHMCCKYDIIHPSEFNAYVIKRDGKIKLKIQAFFNYKEMPEDFPLYFNIGKEDGSYTHNTNWSLSESPKYNDLFIVYSGEFDWPDYGNDTITICPEIYVGENSYIVFDQFKTEVKKEIEEFDPDKVRIADTLFKYYVGKSGLTLSLNIDSNPGCKAYYNLKRHMDPSFVVKGLIIGDDNCYVFDQWQEISDLNTSGQNVFNIKFTTPEWYENNKYKSVKGLNKINSILLEKKCYESDDGNIIINDSNAENGVIKIEKSDNESNNKYIRVHNTFDKEDIYTLEIKVVAEDANNKSVWTDSNSAHKDLVIYVSEYINMYRNLYDNYVGDFTLDEAAFVEAVEHEMKTVELFSKFEKEDNLVYYALKDGVKYPFEFNNDKEDITLDNGDKLYEDFINKEIGSNTPYTETDFSINYGARYSININDKDLIEYPKNQYGAIGRLWTKCHPIDTNLYSVINGKNESLNKVESTDNLKFSFDISSSIDLFGNNEEILKIVADNPITMSNMNYIVTGDYTVKKKNDDGTETEFTWKRIDTLANIWKDAGDGNKWSSGTASFSNRFLYHIEKEDDGAYIYFEWGEPTTKSTRAALDPNGNNDSYVTIFPTEDRYEDVPDYSTSSGGAGSGGGGSSHSSSTYAKWKIKIDDLTQFKSYDSLNKSDNKNLKSMCNFFAGFSGNSSMIANLEETGFDWTSGNYDTTTLDTVNNRVEFPMLCLYFNNDRRGVQDQYEIKRLGGNYGTSGVGSFYNSQFLYKHGDSAGNRWFFGILIPTNQDQKPCIILPTFDYCWKSTADDENKENNKSQKDTALYIIKCIIYYCYLLENIKYCSAIKEDKLNYLYWSSSQNQVSNKYIKNIESHYNLNWSYPTISGENIFNTISTSLFNKEIVHIEDVGKRKTADYSSDILFWVISKIDKYNKESRDSKNNKISEPSVDVGKFFVDNNAININGKNILNEFAKSFIMSADDRILVHGGDLQPKSGIFAQTDYKEFNRQMGFMHRYSFEDN